MTRPRTQAACGTLPNSTARPIEVFVQPDAAVGYRLYVRDRVSTAPAGPRLGRGEALPIEHYHARSEAEAGELAEKLQAYLDRNWNKKK